MKVLPYIEYTLKCGTVVNKDLRIMFIFLSVGYEIRNFNFFI